MYEVYRYRGLLVNLALKELRLQYKHSFLGFIWSMLNPMLMLVVYVVAFKFILRSDIKDFTLFLLIGELPWNFFQSGVLSSTNSLVNNGSLISKVYFPREVIPISLIISNFLNFIFTLIILLFAILAYHRSLTINVLYFPLILLAQLIFMTSLSLLLSILTVRFRDVYHLMQVALMAWFYVSPVVYPLSHVPLKLRIILYFNPMADYIEAYRRVLFYGQPPEWNLLGLCIAGSVILLIASMGLFQKWSRDLVEYL
ncbi:ABC transporter permease [Alicyclobacillus hesperidum]|uniref:ABC transporter permease n=1 Tax=Alicyclobacillus hesperidum TaxID=89784 RepID=UPI0007273906|nr:hypothetical protein SD51_04530 [Alicyclobacillus tengchongensis]